ncbi:MAG TPA: LysR family transcriptional regulator [Burkholderiales bacterium]|nr:LysR family transcriptional regulator [Burkholderiales bacterium]
MARIGDRGEMEAFVRSVELGGFSAAARELKLSPSAISKLVTRLEQTLRARLLSRTTRQLTLTPEGELFLARCRRILAEMEDAETEVGRSRERPRGRLRMSVGVGFGVHQLIPALPRFQERYPEVEVDLHVEDRVEDAGREGLDIVVRPGTLMDDSLVARPLFEFERVLCAAPGYLARHGAPRTADELLQHNCIAVSTRPPYGRWTFDTPAGRQVLDIKGAITVNNADCVLRLGVAGLGIVRLNEFIVADALRRRDLVRVLPELQSRENVPMFAMYPQQRHRLPRVAAMLDFLGETFGARPWRSAR